MPPAKDYRLDLYEKDCKLLIRTLTKFEEEEENFKISLDFVLSNLLCHSYLDVDSHKINRTISRLHEKFQIHSDLEKASTFKKITDKLLNSFNCTNVSKKENGYRVLSLLLQLSESNYSSSFKTQDQSPPSIDGKNDDIDWAEYLKEGEDVYSYLSDTSSEIFSSDDESDEEIEHDLLPLPPRDDSGLGISPDSCSGSSQQQFVTNNFPIALNQEIPLNFPCVVENQDSFYPYWEINYQRSYSECLYNLTTVSFTKHWEDYINKKNTFAVIEKKTVLHERNVIKEIIWMLNGVKDFFLFYWTGSEFQVNSNIHLCNLTSHTLTMVLKEFCVYGTKVALLRRFVDEVLLQDVNVPEFCLTFHTYGATMQMQLRKIADFLCDIEKELRKKNETFTLLIFQEKLKFVLTDIDVLYNMHQEISVVINIPNPFEKACHLVHILWTQLSQQSLKMQRSSSVKIILNVFLRTCKPFFMFLEKLIILGNFNNLHEEFIFSRKTDIEVTDEDFWKNSLILKNLPGSIERYFFLKPFLKDILIAGKSVEILNKITYLLKIETFCLHVENGELYYKFIKILQRFVSGKVPQEVLEIVSHEERNEIQDPLLQQKIFLYQEGTHKFFCPDVNPVYLPVAKKQPEQLFSILQMKTFMIIDNMEPKFPKPLNRSILKSMETCMKYAYYPVCRRLMSALREKFHLLTHISNMKKFFLMESGDLMFSFYSKVFDKIFYAEPWQDFLFLYSVLQNANSGSKDNCENLCIFLDVHNADIQITQPISFLNALQLSYEVEWPMTIILDTQAKNQYSQIFSFLLQIKCAKYLLDKLYSIRLYEKCDRYPNELWRLMSKYEFPRQQKIHGMYVIRMRLLFFVNGLHNYIMSRILHSFGVEFNEKLENSRTIEDIIMAHNSYLKSLHERCLLDRRLPHLKEQIFQVLNLCYSFQQLWLKGIDHVSLEELQNIEVKFSKYCHFLFCFFNTPLRRGVYVHLENLVSSMLSETHVLHAFDNKKGLPEYPEFKNL